MFQPTYNDWPPKPKDQNVHHATDQYTNQLAKESANVSTFMHPYANVTGHITTSQHHRTEDKDTLACI